MTKILLSALLLVGLAHAQHNVVLRFNDLICTATVTTNCNTQGVTYNIYRAPGACPATGVSPSSAPIPFSSLVNIPAATSIGPLVVALTGNYNITLNYTDMGVISPGQSYCYYATVVNGYTVNNITGIVVLNESAPSNYAQAALAVTGSTPLSPMNVQVILQ